MFFKVGSWSFLFQFEIKIRSGLFIFQSLNDVVLDLLSKSLRYILLSHNIRWNGNFVINSKFWWCEFVEDIYCPCWNFTFRSWNFFYFCVSLVHSLLWDWMVRDCDPLSCLMVRMVRNSVSFRLVFTRGVNEPSRARARLV